MGVRTDLAIEQSEIKGKLPDGVTLEKYTNGDVKVTKIVVSNEEAGKTLGKPCGKYITAEVKGAIDGALSDIIKTELCELLPKNGSVLVVGLGNEGITPDSLGPKCAAGVIATRHISEQMTSDNGLAVLRSVEVISPGVLGQTGIETAEIISGIAARTAPAAVLAIDALASRRLYRLGNTVQMTDTGISPGSGVGNSRTEISEKTIGIPVIALGVPTVVDAATLMFDLRSEMNGEQMMITPREIDTIINRAADTISHAINCALQPEYDPEVLRAAMM